MYGSENNARVCMRCSYETQMFFKRKQEFDAAASETKAFNEKLYERSDKFDVICEYLGHGIIKNS